MFSHQIARWRQIEQEIREAKQADDLVRWQRLLGDLTDLIVSIYGARPKALASDRTVVEHTEETQPAPP
jgi:hypothetical protein